MKLEYRAHQRNQARLFSSLVLSLLLAGPSLAQISADEAEGIPSNPLTKALKDMRPPAIGRGWAQPVELSHARIITPGPEKSLMLHSFGISPVRLEDQPIVISVQSQAPLDDTPRTSSPVIVINGEVIKQTRLSPEDPSVLIGLVENPEILRTRNKVEVYWVGNEELTRTRKPLVLTLGDLIGKVAPKERTRFRAVDQHGRAIKALPAGASLTVSMEGLLPGEFYDIYLGIDEPARLENAVSFARLSADSRGRIDPHILWYQSGVIGCSARSEREFKAPFTFRSFDEMTEALAGRNAVITLHRSAQKRSRTGIKDKTLDFRISKSLSNLIGRIPFESLTIRSLNEDFRHASTGPVATLKLPIVKASRPMLYPSDAEGCLRNSREVGKADLYVTGRNFRSGEEVLLSVVPNQRAWYVGDATNDVTGANRSAAPERVVADRSGRFTERVWDSELQARGVYDITAQRNLTDRTDTTRLENHDIVSFGMDSAYILYLRYPVGGPTMDIAGRPIQGFPYFQFSDSFARTGDAVWGAVDPTYVPDSHPGGNYAAYYVVNHRDVNGWDPAVGGATNLVDESGGFEIGRVKSGCVNGTDIKIWEGTLTLGEYDVVVDFGSTPASLAADYATDANYNDNIDFLDGADQVGFVVTEDPYELGPIPIGSTSYSIDDYFPTLGNASDVDLRAVVRYPATASGTDTPVAPGAHPLFIIEHGNHRVCEVVTGVPPYDPEYHASCPVDQRTPNHMGYMRLLDILASHGIIAVSIDAYDLTGYVPQWIPERGQLILKHLELWSHLNDPNTYTSYPNLLSSNFIGHVDMNKISVSGHSRGGEASVAAYQLNTAFNIGSVSSIAPVDGQSYVLPDIPYFVILPAADGDVSNLSGIRIYDRAGQSLPTTDGTNKSGIHVYGANHNFFNTVWASHGDDSDPTRDDYIVAADQQKIGESYLAAFTRLHLNSETVYADMLRGRLIFPSTAGFKIYNMRHEKQHSKVESGTGLATSSSVVSTSVAGPSVHVTQALQVGWNSSGGVLEYTLPTAIADVSAYEVLAFRVAQTNSSNNPTMGSQDFRVDLLGGGKSKATYASRFDAIPKPYDHPYYSSDHNVMTNVRIPLQTFIMNNSGIPLNNIDTLRFTFSYPSQGEIYIDDIEFSR
jgi:hypothetical protein